MSTDGAIDSKPRSRRKRIKGEVRREQILTAALELFAERGYANATTASIAKAVGVSEPILYQHFKSKKDILMTLMDQNRENLLGHWQELADSVKSPLELIGEIGATWNKYLNKQYHAIRLIDNVVSETQDPEIKQLLRTNYKAYEQFFMTILDRAKESGEIRQDIDTRLAAWQIISYGKTSGLIKHIGLRGFSIPEYLDLMFKQLVVALKSPETP